MSGLTIGIIGGTGGMGRWFEKFFTDNGYRVLIAGRKTELTYHDLAGKCRVVVLSTPLQPALEIIESIGPALGPDQLLVDLCSQKEMILERMTAATTADVIGTHPLFGPDTPSVYGQNVIVCPVRDKGGWFSWLESLFSAKGGVVTRMDPAEHDRNMALTQSLMHFLTLSLARLLQRLDLTTEDALRFATPIFRINIDLVGRLFAQDINLYQGLVSGNPYAPDILEKFFTAMEECRAALFSGKEKKALDFMESIRAFLREEFCRQALKETSRALETMYQQEKDTD